MPDATNCPKCLSVDVRFRPKLKDWTCDECGHCWKAPAPVEPPRSLRIFLSYGHDEHTESALRIKADLEARGHKVWFDAERLREGRDWEQYIEEGLQACDKVVLLMTPHSVRRRNPRDPATRDGYCLNEIAKAIEKNKLIVPAMLVTLEDGPPTSICRIQYLDLRDCVPIAGNEDRYRVRFERLARAIEQDDLDFEGGQARLQRLLRPLSFDAEMSRHIARFTGRQWLVAEIDRWLVDNPASRVFWLSGPPGIGKSAMATHLVHRRGDVIGYHLCVHGHDDKGDPSRAVLSLAYQVAQHLPEYDKALKALDLEQEVGKNAGTLFDNLFVKPLSGNFPAPDGPRLLVIDAIDEATRGGRNEIAELIRDHWDKVPSWLRLVITSRPEVEVVTTLGHLKPFLLDAQRAENLEDLRRYLERELAARNLSQDERTLAAILAASEAVFLYVVVLLEEIDQGRMTLDDLDDLPVGMAGHYQRFFTRQYPDSAEYHAAIAPLLQCICSAREPLPLDVLARATNLSSNQVRARLVRVGSMFPIRKVANQEDTIRPFHKSVRDWLTALDENTHLPRAGGYFVDADLGEKRLADACWAEYRSDVRGMSAYSLRHLPGHLVAVGRGGDAAEPMTDFGYHHQRLKVLGAPEVQNIADDFVLVTGRNGLQPAARTKLGVWKNFYREISHLLQRATAGLVPEIYLLQLAVAHADTSAVTASAEAWLEEVGSDRCWLRSIRRPKVVPTNPCLQTFEGHRGAVTCVVPSACERFALSGSEDGDLRLWDIESGRCLRKFSGHTDHVNAALFLPDGHRAVSGSDDSTVRIWDLDSGRCLRVFKSTGTVRAFSLVPGGKELLASMGPYLQRLDFETGACSCEVVSGLSLAALAMICNGRKIVSVNMYLLKVWDIELASPSQHTFTPGGDALGVLLDDRRVVVGGRDALYVYDIETETLVLKFKLPRFARRTRAVAVLPDGCRVVSGSEDGKLWVWDVATGDCLRIIPANVGGVLSVTVLSDGRRVLCGGKDRSVKLIDLDVHDDPSKEEDEKRAVHAIALSSDGHQALSGHRDHVVRLWSTENGVCTRTFEGHESGVYAVEFLPDGSHAISYSGCGLAYSRSAPILKVWDLAAGQCSRTLGEINLLEGLAPLPDGKRVLADTRLLDLETGQCVRRFEGHAGNVWAVSVSPDGRLAVSAGEDKTVKLWDIQSGQCLQTFEGHTEKVFGAVFLPDGQRVLSCSFDKTLRLWDLESGRCVRIYQGHTEKVRDLALLADGNLAVSVPFESGTPRDVLRVWDLQTGQCVAVWQTRRALACCSAGGDIVASGTDGGDVLLLRLMRPGPLARTTLATWSPTHALVASALDTGAIALLQWHAGAGQVELVVRSEPLGAPVADLRFSADGARVLARTEDKREQVLDAATLKPASQPVCPWAAARDLAPDGRWRAVIREGRLEIVPANI